VSVVLLWDIDGTLLTTARAGVFALEAALKDVCGIEAELSELATAGLTDGEVAALALATCGGPTDPATVEAFLRAYERHLPATLHRRRGAVMPGVCEILGDLHGRPRVVSLLLTGNTPAGATAKLRHYGLDHYFAGDGAFCVGSGTRESIARSALELVAGVLGEEPAAERLYVIGDTPHDVRAGKAIGARTIAVASGSYTPEELEGFEPWIVLERLPEPERFRRLLGID
jgi:phosphoglycolate phosphatase